MDVKIMTFFFVSAYVIKAGGKTVLFDCGAILEPEKLSGFLEEQGVDPAEIDLIIVSHEHFDHMQLLGAWKDLIDAPVLCHRNAAGYLETGKKDSLYAFGEKARVSAVRGAHGGVLRSARSPGEARHRRRR